MTAPRYRPQLLLLLFLTTVITTALAQPHPSKLHALRRLRDRHHPESTDRSPTHRDRQRVRRSAPERAIVVPTFQSLVNFTFVPAASPSTVSSLAPSVSPLYVPVASSSPAPHADHEYESPGPDDPMPSSYGYYTDYPSAPYPSATPPGDARLLNRPLLPLPPQPVLMINISWATRLFDNPMATYLDEDDLETSYPPSGVFENLYRAEVDSAISVTVGGTSYVMGPGCHDSFRTPFASFSGDDAYAPGWEAYLLRLEDLLAADVKTDGAPESTVESSPEPGHDGIAIYAAWHLKPGGADVFVTATLYDAAGVSLQRETVSVDPGLGDGHCATTNDDMYLSRNPIAFLTFLATPAAALLTSPPLFVLGVSSLPQDGVYETPDPSWEYGMWTDYPTMSEEPEETPETPETTETPETAEPPPPTTELVLDFSWVTDVTDIESGIRLPGRRVTSTCDWGIPFVRHSGNSFSFKGTETFYVAIEELLEARRRNASLSIELLATWYGGFESEGSPKSRGTASVTAYVRSPEGDLLTPKETIEVYPDSGFDCRPSRVVGTAQVRRTANGGYSVSLDAEPDFTPEDWPYTTDEPWDPSAEPSWDSTPWQEDFNETVLKLAFSWPPDEFDLDTGVRLGDLIRGVFCDGYASAVRFRRDMVGLGESEEYVVLLDRSLSQGVWTDEVDIDLFAAWYGRQTYADAEVVVSAELVSAAGVRLQTYNVSLNPVSEFGNSCTANKVGRIRVATDGNGMFSVDLAKY